MAVINVLSMGECSWKKWDEMKERGMEADGGW